MNGVLLYDGDCGFCTSSADWLQHHAFSTADVVAWQLADLGALGVAAEDCADALQWVDDGHRAAGPDAVAAYLRTSTRPWRAAGRVLATPVTRRVSWPVYRWVARNRGRLPGRAGDTELPRVPPPVQGIRRRRSKDLPACSRLLRLVFSESHYPHEWPDAPRAWLENADVVDAWVAERQGEILGHAAISRVGMDGLSELRWREVTGHDPADLLCVSRLFVRPRVRNQGIGTALLAVAAADIRARGLHPVLDVVSSSEDAVRLFEDRGWHLIAMDPLSHRSRLRVFRYDYPA